MSEQLLKDRPAHLITEGERIFAILAMFGNELHELTAALTKESSLDVDEFSLPGAPAQTIYVPQRNYYLPIVVDYVLCTFPSTTTSATLQLGNRIIPIGNLTAGIFQADVKQQLEWDDIRQLTINPGGAAFIEIMGHCDIKQRDKP